MQFIFKYYRVRVCSLLFRGNVSSDMTSDSCKWGHATCVFSSKPKGQGIVCCVNFMRCPWGLWPTGLIAGHGNTTNHKQALRVHHSKSHQQYFLWKNPKFSPFLTCCFYSLERLLFLSRILSGTEKLPIFDQNQWQPLWKNPKFLTF